MFGRSKCGISLHQSSKLHTNLGKLHTVKQSISLHFCFVLNVYSEKNCGQKRWVSVKNIKNNCSDIDYKDMAAKRKNWQATYVKIDKKNK